MEFADVADPRAPGLAGRYDLEHGCADVVVVDGIAYALAPASSGQHEFRLHVIDASDAAQPVGIGELRLDDPAPDRFSSARLAIGNGHVFAVTLAASGESDRQPAPRLHVIDVADPARPIRVAVVELSSPAFSVAYDDGYVFLAQAGGVSILDVRDPANPLDVITLLVSGTAADVLAADGLVYAAAGASGLYVYAPHLPGWEPWVATPTPTVGDSTPTATSPTPTATDVATAGPPPIVIYVPAAER
ncbi:MAG: hypothetical protein ACK2T6_05100 [Anaerolineae bacterium]